MPLPRRTLAAVLCALTLPPVLAAAKIAEWEFYEPRPREHSRLAKPPQTFAVEFAGRRVDPGPGWSGLSDADREAVRQAQVTPLQAGDEPPYPRSGLKPLIERLYRVRGPEGQPLRVHLQIGPLGQIEAIGAEGPASQAFVGQLLVLLQNSGYKPGLCAEKVCSRPLTLDLVYLGEQ